MLPGKYKTVFMGKEIPILYVTDKAEAETLLGRLCEQPEQLYSIDTETESLPEFNRRPQAALSPHLSSVRLVQIYTGRTAIILDCKFIGQVTNLRRFLEQARLVGHNSIFDLQYFYKQFGVTKCNIGCTYLVAKLIFHATQATDTGLSASLRALVNTVFKTEIVKEMQTSDWSIPDLSFEQVEYSALDAISTYYLAEKIAHKLETYGLTRIYKLYKDAQHPIAKLQLNGIKLDVDAHRDLIVQWRDDLYKAKKKLQAVTKLSSITSTTIGTYLKDTLPPETLAIWPRTETGKLATDAHVFADYDYLELVKPFAEFQRNEKLCTAFGNRLIEQVNPKTGRLHAQYKLAGARTGRLSCSNPNLQQLPRDNNVRQNFIPERGKVFVCADYNQVEIRVGAELSRDAVMLKAYRDGIDLHKLTASLISHKDIEDVTKQDRQKAKAFNFGLMFGLGAKKFSHYAKKSYGADVSQDEAERGVSTFRKTYSGYRKWQLSQSTDALRRGYVTTPCGKRRCLDAENSYGASMNTPVQGGASECMLYALIRMDNLGLKLVNCVHDEVSVECLSGFQVGIKSQIEDCMTKGFLDVFPNGITRGLVDCKSGNSWGECKE